ncbi:SDR family NAD(P)-dependent oxidoreductase [Paracoccus shanxieyensis]|uniref:SDR family oxidoreductase n=1 Tax=Paracoccus shanxieyensis TaxID=2675752 RepID=A0A6L6J492_9RHOB|nr:SDR family oxidoreductase [Paracoccus shanxieyensis]MTH66678.1 SDR family oxidoreductase [Paracoccus shanxieyensis]MTH89913.1 SDR family oxidoreductase [Paracoccus shanxieyensis]
MSGLAGYKIIVVGGAAGIGLSTARMMAARGGAVGVIDRAALADDAFASAMADLTDAGAVQQAMTTLAKMLGGIDILVNCAGIDLEAATEDVSDEAWAHVIDVNLSGPMRTCRAAFPWLKASGRGAIVNVSSAAGLRPIADRAAYCSAKAGLVMLSKSLAFDWAKHAIRVNTVCPGAVHTDLFDRSWQGKEDPQARLQQIRDRYPLGRIAEPEELAEAITYLAGPTAAYVTGTTLAVDGGRSFH